MKCVCSVRGRNEPSKFGTNSISKTSSGPVASDWVVFWQQMSVLRSDW